MRKSLIAIALSALSLSAFATPPVSVAKVAGGSVSASGGGSMAGTNGGFFKATDTGSTYGTASAGGSVNQNGTNSNGTGSGTSYATHTNTSTAKGHGDGTSSAGGLSGTISGSTYSIKQYNTNTSGNQGNPHNGD